MCELTELTEGDKVEWVVDDGEKTVVGEITDKRMEIMGSTLTGDKRDVLTFSVDIKSDDVFYDQMVVDEEMETLRSHDDGDDESEIVADGGKDVTSHVDDATIEAAIESNDDTDHPEAWTVDEIRDLLAWVQRSFNKVWDVYMDQVEDGSAEVVAETSNIIVLSMGELNSVAEELEYYEGDLDREVDSIAKTIVTQVHHELANQRCDRNWSVDYPFVARKPDSFDAGQRYVEAVINGLQSRGLSPGQSWAYYGVKIRGNSRNSWSKRCGYSDHSAVSEPLRKAEQKIP